jgi:hypothetical protein
MREGNVGMATQQLLVRIPEELRAGSSGRCPRGRQRVRAALAGAGPGSGGQRGRSAVSRRDGGRGVEADERLSAKITEWDGTIAERLEGETWRNAGEPARRACRRRAAGRRPRVAPQHGTLLTRRPRRTYPQEPRVIPRTLLTVIRTLLTRLGVIPRTLPTKLIA